MLANEADSDPELALLSGDAADDDKFTGEADHALRTAPIFTGDAYERVDSSIFSQRGLYGCLLESSSGAKINSSKLFVNLDAPFSGIVCGVQGSGKSHSTSVILESSLICDKRLGALPAPLSALMFHFDTAAGAGEVQPCEAACLSSLDPSLEGDAIPPNVVVLVPARNLTTMRRVYSRFPGITVAPLHFAPENLNAYGLLAMMKIDQDQHMPLYMECVMTIVRDMEPFSYGNFREQLKEHKFSESQKSMLDQRLSILDSFLDGGNAGNCVSRHFKKGQLTIIDLSAPFMDASSACGIFDIILGLFIQTKAVVGKLVVLDEAHKYLTNSGGSSRLTESLLTVIREQRHLGIRVLISTQEPTVVPSKFLDLCSFVIAHRFSSPKWLDHLKEHVSVENAEWRSKVITLRTGEAMIFAPAALIHRQGPESVVPLGQGYLKVQSRARITADGGRSVLATASASDHAPNRSSSPSLSSMIKNDDDGEQTHVVDDPHVGVTALPRTNDFHLQSHLRDDLNGGGPPSLPDTDGTGFSSSNHIPGESSRTLRAVHGASANSPVITESSRNGADDHPHTAISALLASSGPVSISEARFRPLVSILQKRAKAEEYQVSFSELGTELKRLTSPTLYVKLTDYLMEAKKAGIVKIGGTKEASWVQLSVDDSYPPEYFPLERIMNTFLDDGQEQPRRSDVAMELYRLYPGIVPNRKAGRYILRAEEAGVVRRCKHDRLKL